jgi:hypothetical protein
VGGAGGVGGEGGVLSKISLNEMIFFGTGSDFISGVGSDGTMIFFVRLTHVVLLCPSCLQTEQTRAIFFENKNGRSRVSIFNSATKFAIP